MDPFARQIEKELSGSFFDTGVDKTKAILQIREFGKARDPETGELQCPDCAAVGDTLLDYLSRYDAEHPVEAGTVGFGRFSKGALDSVTELPYQLAGNLVLGTINDANGGENRIGDFSLHNIADPLIAANNYYDRMRMGRADVLGDATSLARRAGSTIADGYHDTKDIYDRRGLLMALDARSQGLGEAAGTIAGMATGYGEYRTARRLEDLTAETTLGNGALDRAGLPVNDRSATPSSRRVEINVSGESGEPFAASFETPNAPAHNIPPVEEEALAGSIRTVNPKFPATGFTKNCVECVIATEKRFAGKPGSPARPTSGPLPTSLIEKEFGGSFQKVAGPMEIASILRKAGNGSRGIVYGADHARGYGHVWNVRLDNGVIRFLDSQPGRQAGLGVHNFDHFTDFEFLLTFSGNNS